MEEVCGTLRGDIAYTRAILTFYKALPELFYRIQNPNKAWGFIGSPIPGPLDPACATALNHITAAINFSTMAERAVLRLCDASLLKGDGDLNWVRLSEFIKENNDADPIKKAKRITVSSAILRLLATDILGTSEIIEQFRARYPASATVAGRPFFEYRNHFYESVRAAITAINAACTSHPRIINFATDTMKGKVGSLRIERLTQTGGGGEGGPNAGGTGISLGAGPVLGAGVNVAAGGRPAYYAPPPPAEEEAEEDDDAKSIANAAEKAAFIKWRDCTQPYDGPNKLDRDSICILVSTFQSLKREYNKLYRKLYGNRTEVEAKKNKALGEVEAAITKNDPTIAKLAAKEVVRTEPMIERYTKYMQFTDVFNTIYNSLFRTAEHIRYKFFKIDVSTNVGAIRDFKSRTNTYRATERKEGGYRRRKTHRRATRKRHANKRKTRRSN
jgi:hypothetical protein